jgi:exodeoxyribonuclease VII small subunit
MTKKSDQVDFEGQLKELEGLIQAIESGKDGLNSSVEKYAKARDLAKQLEDILAGAKSVIEKEELEGTGEEEE